MAPQRSARRKSARKTARSKTARTTSARTKTPRGQRAAKRTTTGRGARPAPPQLTPLSRLPVPEYRSLDADIKKYFRVCKERLGLVPNVLRAFTLRPEKFRTFTAKYNELMLGEETGLTQLEREMIAVTVSSRNHCFYCLTAHGAAVRELSKDPILGDILASNYREARLSDRHRAMLDYAWKLTESPWLVGDTDHAALRAVGFGDEDIFDITDVVAYFNYTNRMSSALGLQPNKEYFAQARRR